MRESSPLARLGLWRVTRHPVARRCYDALSARGVFVAQLDRFERPVDGSGATMDAGQEIRDDGPPQLEFDIGRATEHLPDRLRSGPVAPGDTVVLARRDGDPVGHCCCTRRTVYVPELHRRLSPPGVYLWGLYVDPDARGEGVGTALVGRAVRWAREATDVATMSALVAPDNLPSRRAFASLDFAPRHRYTSAGLLGRTVHRDRPLDD